MAGGLVALLGVLVVGLLRRCGLRHIRRGDAVLTRRLELLLPLRGDRRLVRVGFRLVDLDLGRRLFAARGGDALGVLIDGGVAVGSGRQRGRNGDRRRDE